MPILSPNVTLLLNTRRWLVQQVEKLALELVTMSKLVSVLLFLQWMEMLMMLMMSMTSMMSMMFVTDHLIVFQELGWF